MEGWGDEREDLTQKIELCSVSAHSHTRGAPLHRRVYPRCRRRRQRRGSKFFHPSSSHPLFKSFAPTSFCTHTHAHTALSTHLKLCWSLICFVECNEAIKRNFSYLQAKKGSKNINTFPFGILLTLVLKHLAIALLELNVNSLRLKSVRYCSGILKLK